MTAANGIVVAANDVMATAFYLSDTITITHITIDVTTPQGSAATVDAGLYNSAGTLVVNTAGFDGNSGTLQTLAVAQGSGSVTLTKGWYWYAYTASVTNATLRASNFNINASGTARAQFNARATTYLAGKATNAATAGILPGTLPTLNAPNNVNMLAAFFCS